VFQLNFKNKQLIEIYINCDTTTWSEYTVDDIMEELTDESSEPDVSNA
jgi:hypothetical protein